MSHKKVPEQGSETLSKMDPPQLAIFPIPSIHFSFSEFLYLETIVLDQSAYHRTVDNGPEDTSSA